MTAGPCYSQERWTLLLDETIRSIRALSVLKGGEYAGDSDRLANFRRNAEALELTPEQVWRVYAGKHWDAISQWVKDMASGRQRTVAEPISGRLDDLIVYCILLKAMAEERDSPVLLPEMLSNQPVPLEALCSHQWHRLDRYTDTCVFCNSMRPSSGRRTL